MLGFVFSGYVDSSSVGFTAQGNQPSQPNHLHYGLNHQTSYLNHNNSTSSTTLNSMNVDEQKIPGCFQTRQSYNQVDFVNKSEATVVNSTRSPDASLSAKSTGNNVSLSASNGPSYNVNSSEQFLNVHPSSHPDRSQRFLQPTSPSIYSQQNLQPGQFDISKYRGDIVSYRNCQPCQSLTNNTDVDILKQRPNNEIYTSQSRSRPIRSACPYGRNVLTSSSHPQRSVIIRGTIPIDTLERLPSSVLLKSSISGKWIPYYPRIFHNRPNSSKLHIPNTDISSTNPQQHGSGFHQDIERPGLDITSSPSRFNMAALPSSSPFSHDYSNKSTTISYTLDYLRDRPSPQSPESPGIPLFSSNTPHSGVYNPLANPNYFRLQSNEDSRIGDQTFQRPTPYDPYCYNSLSQNRLDHPIQTHQLPTHHNSYRYNSLGQNHIANPVQIHQVPTSYNPCRYNSLGQNHITNSVQTHQVPTYYNPYRYNSSGQNHISNPVQTHQVPTSYNPCRYNSLSQNRLARPIAQLPPSSTRYAHTPLPNSSPTGPKTTILQTLNTDKQSSAIHLLFQNDFTNKNHQSGFGQQWPDVSRYRYNNTADYPNGSVLTHTNFSTNQPPPIELSSAVIPANPVDQPNDDTSLPLVRRDEPTNLQTICNKRSETSSSVPSAQSSLVQRNLNNYRETVLKLKSSDRSSNIIEQDATDVPICVVVLSDDKDSSSNDSHKLVIDYDSASPRSPTTDSSNLV